MRKPKTPKPRTPKYEEKVSVPEGATFADLVNMAVKGKGAKKKETKKGSK